MSLSSSFVACLALMSTTGWAQYVLEDDFFANGDFFSSFTFWDSADPTHGFVDYLGQSAAQSAGLISQSSSNAKMLADSTNVVTTGRPSIRITSNKSYNSGLIILDADHMPEGCGTWPAFWSVGPDWPSQGEVDIIEGVNEQSANAMTLHTGPGCTITNNGNFTGTLGTDNCDINAAGQSTNAGCSITASSSQTYGAGFNANNGGVYAMEWTDSAISIFFFPRGSIPSDITNGNPTPSGWGKPLSQFQGGCDIETKFTNQQIVFDLTFCGDWAGAVWTTGSCASKADTCNNYVANNPSAFADAYWSVNALAVYQASSGSNGGASSSAVQSSSTSVSVAQASTSSVPIIVTSSSAAQTTTSSTSSSESSTSAAESTSSSSESSTTEQVSTSAAASSTSEPQPSSTSGAQTSTSTSQSIDSSSVAASSTAPETSAESSPAPTSTLSSPAETTPPTSSSAEASATTSPATVKSATSATRTSYHHSRPSHSWDGKHWTRDAEASPPIFAANEAARRHLAEHNKRHIGDSL